MAACVLEDENRPILAPYLLLLLLLPTFNCIKTCVRALLCTGFACVCVTAALLPLAKLSESQTQVLLFLHCILSINANANNDGGGLDF